MTIFFKSFLSPTFKYRSNYLCNSGINACVWEGQIVICFEYVYGLSTGLSPRLSLQIGKGCAWCSFLLDFTDKVWLPQICSGICKNRFKQIQTQFNDSWWLFTSHCPSNSLEKGYRACKLGCLLYVVNHMFN